MARSRAFHAVLLAASVLVMGGCASQPEGSLVEKKFQRAAKHYEVNFLYEGQGVYCKRGATRSLPLTQCVTESQLRAQVENSLRSRGTSSGSAVPAGAGQGYLGD
jgi:hypothetical protein